MNRMTQSFTFPIIHPTFLPAFVFADQHSIPLSDLSLLVEYSPAPGLGGYDKRVDKICHFFFAKTGGGGLFFFDFSV